MTYPSGTGIPFFLKISLPMYSYRFKMSPPCNHLKIDKFVLLFSTQMIFSGMSPPFPSSSKARTSVQENDSVKTLQPPECFQIIAPCAGLIGLLTADFIHLFGNYIVISNHCISVIFTSYQQIPSRSYRIKVNNTSPSL